jgi:hypothetical protein
MSDDFSLRISSDDSFRKQSRHISLVAKYEEEIGHVFPHEVHVAFSDVGPSASPEVRGAAF